MKIGYLALIFGITLTASISCRSQSVVIQGEYSNKPVEDSMFKVRMHDLDEELLSEKELCSECEIFRFTWLRSFDNPLIIRMEKQVDEYWIYYRVGRGEAGYEQKGIKKKGRQKLTASDWFYFKELVNRSGFDTVSNQLLFTMTDGARWILEHKTEGRYKGHETNLPKYEIEPVCLYLLELAGLKYGKNQFQLDYGFERIYLDRNNRIIRETDILDTVIVALNKWARLNSQQNVDCYYADYILTLNSKGNVSKVKAAIGGSWVENKIFGLKCKKCIKAFKNALSKIDFSYLKLDKKIKVYLDISYDRQVNIFRSSD